MMEKACNFHHHHHRRRYGASDSDGGGSVGFRCCDYRRSSSSSSSSLCSYRWRWWCQVVLVVLCWSFTWGWGEAEPTDSNKDRITSGPFEGVDRIRVVSCTSGTADPEITTVKLFDPRNNTSLVYITLRSKQCHASSIFSSCDLDEGQHKVTLRAIINDLEPGEVRVYGCSVIKVTDTAVTDYAYANVSFTEPPTTSTISTTTTSGSTVHAGNALGSTHADDGLHLPNSVTFVVLGLLVFFVTLCCVLGIQYYRGRRRKRKSRDCDAISVRSGVTDKDFYTVGLNMNPNGATGNGLGRMVGPQGSFVRQFSISSVSGGGPPGGTSGGASGVGAQGSVLMPGEVPGGHGTLPNRLVMQYQKPSDCVVVPDVGTLTFSDRGYVSGSSVHYQEPWGRTLDDPEILGKLSTLRSPHRANLVRIPDFQAPSPDPPPPLPASPPSAPVSTSSSPPPSPILPPTQESAEPPAAAGGLMVTSCSSAVAAAECHA